MVDKFRLYQTPGDFGSESIFYIARNRNLTWMKLADNGSEKINQHYGMMAVNHLNTVRQNATYLAERLADGRAMLNRGHRNTVAILPTLQDAQTLADFLNERANLPATEITPDPILNGIGNLFLIVAALCLIVTVATCLHRHLWTHFSIGLALSIGILAGGFWLRKMARTPST
jgi:hypothetical protein